MRKRKLMSLALALVLLITALPSFVFAQGFKDIDGHWAQRNIEWAAKEGYINGYPDGTFKPNAPITKAEYYRITNQFIKKNTDKVKESKVAPSQMLGFSDVQKKDWFYDEVALGIQAGYLDPGKEGNGLLNPTEAILREEATWIFSKNQDWPENEEAAKRMKDFHEISQDRKGLVGAAIEKRVIRGSDKGYFMPLKTLTRAEVVTIIAQFLHPDGLPGPSPSPSPSPNPQGAWTWSFSNSSPNFTQGYRVNKEVLDKFSSYVTPSDAATMRKWMRKQWGGSCYGMAVTAGLYKEGRMKTSGLNTPNTDQIYAVKPQANYNAQSMINVYHLAQFAKSIKAKEATYGTGWRIRGLKETTNDLGVYAQNLKKMINKAKSENTSLQLAYFWPGAGHANTIYDYKEDGNKLVLKVYDPNYPGLNNQDVVLDLKAGTMTARSASNAGQPTQTIGIQRSYAMPTKHILEGVKDTPALANLVMVQIYGKKPVTIYSGSESWTLEPSKGQVALDGLTYTYYIPQRDAYTVTGSGPLSLSIAGKDYTVGLDTDGFSKVLLTPRSVNLEGQKGAYYLNVAQNTASKNFKWSAMEASGQNGSRLALTKEDFGFTLRGDKLQGAQLTALDKFKETNKTYTGRDRMVQIRQSGDNLVLVPNKYGDYDVLPDLTNDLVGSWIGQDTFTQRGVRTYPTEATMFISKNANGTYKVIKRVEVPGLRTSYVLEYNQINFNQTTRELELRSSKCRVLEGNRTIRGANQGPIFRNGQLNTNYGNGYSAHYTRF